MRRSSLVTFGVPVGVTLLGLAEFLPLITHAAFFGPIISTVCNCDPVGGITANGVTVPSSAPAWGCIIATFQNALDFFVSFATVIITIFIAWAGFSYMTSGGSPEKRQLANRRILNAVIGLVITLCAWLLVNSLLNVLYNPNTPFGPWNTILAGNGAADCLAPIKNPSALPGISAAMNTNNAPGSTQQSTVPAGGGKGGTAQCSPNNPACSVQALESNGLTQAQAQAMSCIAVSESSGIPSKYNSSSGACGTFQILSGHASSNWNKASLHSGNCSAQTACTDASCNLQTATLMFQQSGYQPWICPGCNATAHACVANFDPGHGE